MISAWSCLHTNDNIVTYGVVLAVLVMELYILQVECTTEAEPTGSIFYSSHIQHSIGNYFQERMDFPPATRIMANYSIRYQTKDCCPVILLRRLYNGWETSPRIGYYEHCETENMQQVALYTPHYIYAKSSFPNSGCITVGSETVCDGTRTLTSYTPVQWAHVVFFECGDTPRKGINITIENQVDYFVNTTYTCEKIQVPYCTNMFGYNTTAFPNALAHENQADANRLLVLLQRAGPLLTCYQHVQLFACYALFPGCENGRRIYPCIKMCLDAKVACGAILERIAQPIQCGSLPDSLDPDVCIYRPVECPEPKPPKYGSVQVGGRSMTNLSRYECGEGYQLVGSPIQKCEASGRWNSRSPKCKPLIPDVLTKTSPGSDKHITLIAVLVPVICISIIVLSLGICCHKELKHIILYNKFMTRFQRGHDPQKLFIAYSSLDNVSDEFVPELKAQLPGWTVQTYQDDFIPGRRILDCVQEGIWDSNAVLVLLTENFVRSSWCLFEFTEAETRSVRDKGFKLIVVLFSKDYQVLPVEILEDLPDSLKTYIRSRVYLPLWEMLFWHKLRQALAVK